jgi:hypothetical protein
LFKAAEDGCLQCVKHLVENEGIDPAATSTTCRYTALGFAEWSQQHGQNLPGCADVAAYLRQLRHVPPVNRERVTVDSDVQPLELSGMAWLSGGIVAAPVDAIDMCPLAGLVDAIVAAPVDAIVAAPVDAPVKAHNGNKIPVHRHPGSTSHSQICDTRPAAKGSTCGAIV